MIFNRIFCRACLFNAKSLFSHILSQAISATRLLYIMLEEYCLVAFIRTMSRKRKSDAAEANEDIQGSSTSASSSNTPVVDIYQSSSRTKSSKKSFLTDREILDKLPEHPQNLRFIKGKGIVNPDDNKLLQFCVLGRWSRTGYLTTSTGPAPYGRRLIRRAIFQILQDVSGGL